MPLTRSSASGAALSVPRRTSIRAADQMRSTGSRRRNTATGRTPRASKAARIIDRRETGSAAYAGVMSAVSRIPSAASSPTK